MIDDPWPHAALAHYGQALARNIERALASSGHSMRALANAMGITHSTISRVAHGRVPRDLGTLARL
ncbi:helix-turn-helix domain-containing protein [Streptomyces sp. NBC_00271]|uniref:helix-turn-helix domain-containing protein n=1 Tax=Streptomyces sp. NBC_00271 TaxID=2975697 RepID=UPI002E2B7755|nr:helix-turn-helix transcriptional regulator [Streptomyces sp. NBC_00271]